MRASIVTIPSLAFRHKSTNPYYNALLTLLDSLFACLVVAPAVVGYWRSVWQLMGIYVYPEDSMKTAIVSTAIGFVGHGIANFGQTIFKEHFHPDKHRLTFYVASRTYTLVFGVVCVNGWRGPWFLLDRYTELELTTVVVTVVVAVVALLVMRALRNISGAPFAIVNDSVEGYFEIASMFRVPIQKTSLYILDTVFSVYVVGTLVVFVWRGAWILIDIYLFPKDFVRSSWASLVIGYGGAFFAYLLQPLVRWLCERVSGGLRLAIADAFVLFCFIFTVNTWRAIWNLLNIYFIPDDLELSCWITHWVCLILLVLLKCSNSLLVRGVYIDGEESGGKCVVFPIYYLRLIFDHEKSKKMKKIQQELTNRFKMETDNTNNKCGVIITNHKNNS